MTGKLSFRISTEELEADLDLEPRYTARSEASSSHPPSPNPPPFSSLYFPSPSAVRQQVDAYITEPPPPAFAPVAASEGPISPSAVEAEVKAALPQDTKGKLASKSLDDGEPPPPYTEGSSPLEGFTYVMAAAGGAASIITQVQQGGPAPVNTLGG